MIVTTRKPPVWDEAHQHFDLDDRNTVYTYGDYLHNPGDAPIDEFLHRHEGVHAHQQMAYPGGPAAWWKRYFADPAFRADQEASAYGQQFRMYGERIKDREKRARFLHHLAGDFSSDMYGVGITRGVALASIRARSMTALPHSPTPLLYEEGSGEGVTLG